MRVLLLLLAAAGALAVTPTPTAPATTEPVVDGCEQKTLVGDAFKACDFYLDDELTWPQGFWTVCPSGKVDASGVTPFTPPIASRDGTSLGLVTSAGPNEFLDEYGNWQPLSELDPRLNPGQFRATATKTGVPKLGYAPFSGRAWKSVQDVYVRVRFSSWTVLNEDGTVHGKVTTPTDGSCVIFYVGYCMKMSKMTR